MTNRMQDLPSIVDRLPLDIRGALASQCDLVPQEQRKHQMTIRIPERIRDLIKVQADDERRTAADVVNNILVAHYSARGNARRSRRR